MKRSRRQRELRRRRREEAFIFDESLSRCLATVHREDWEFSISVSGGDVARAAGLCGIAGVPHGAKVLWGTSAEDALGTYRRWRNRSGG